MLHNSQTRIVKIGNLKIGGGNPIRVQSMTSVPAEDVKKSLKEIEKLAKAGCEIIRLAIPDEKSARAIVQIKKDSPLPIIADIHFDYHLALLAIEAGVDKLRINPGNIGSEEKIQIVAEAAKKAGIPIRIGVNSGSLAKNLRGENLAEKMVDSALTQIQLLEKFKFSDILISVKAGNANDTLAAYRLLAQKTNYPLHIGLTAAGGEKTGATQAAVTMGTLLAEGIGDTIRISLTANHLREVTLAREILETLDLRKPRYGKLIACPVCGRCGINLKKVLLEAEKLIELSPPGFSLAIMGCAVNGPGETGKTDLGLIGGKKCAALLVKGKIIKTVPEKAILPELKKLWEQAIKKP